MALNESEVREKIRAFITKELIRDASYPLGNDEEF